MEDSARDRISEAFADLTALLEDAAGFAVEGQSRRRSVAELKSITLRVRPLLDASEITLSGIVRALAEEVHDRKP